MKMRYLPEEVRRNLHILRKTTDPKVKEEVLTGIYKRPKFTTLQALWEYRKWLSNEQIINNPVLG